MYSSLDKVDLAIDGDDGKIAIQTDHRTAEEILEDEPVSTLFALTRAINPERMNEFAGVRFSMAETPPSDFVELLTVSGAEVEVASTEKTYAAAADKNRRLEIAQKSLGELGQRVLEEHSAEANTAGLEAIESALFDRAFEAGGKDEDEITFWTCVVELGAAVGTVLHGQFGGEWAEDSAFHSAVPFVFTLQTGSGEGMANVFGKVERFFDEGSSEAPSKMLTLAASMEGASDDAKVMFCLRPSTWAAQENALSAPLLAPSERASDADVPLVALVHDMPETTRTISSEITADQAADFRAEAMSNIETLAVTVGEVELGFPALVIQGDYYAAEKVLDVDFMQSLQERLDTDDLLVAVPVRGAAFVSPADAEVPRVAMMQLIAKQLYDDAPANEQISNTVFVFRDGIPVSLANIDKPDIDDPETTAT